VYKPHLLLGLVRGRRLAATAAQRTQELPHLLLCAAFKFFLLDVNLYAIARHFSAPRPEAALLLLRKPGGTDRGSFSAKHETVGRLVVWCVVCA
jgi:hypothetical protein